MVTFATAIIVLTAIAALIELFTDRRRNFFLACLVPIAFAIFLATVSIPYP